MDAGPIVLCRQPWMPEGVADAALVHWAVLCRERLVARRGLPATAPCVRLDAWSAHLVEPPPSGSSRPRVRPIRGLRVSLGAGILRCLVQQLGRLSAPDDQPFGWLWDQSAVPPVSARWLLLACEALLADYRWGPDYAWRRLLGAIRQRLPSTRRRAFDVRSADLAFQNEVRDYVRRLGQVIRPPSPPAAGAAQTCVLLGGLFAREALGVGLQSVEAELGVKLVPVAARWLEWLAHSRHPALLPGK
jgi:hypothetical protein